MRMLVLAQARGSYTTRRLVEAAKRARHKVDVHSPVHFRLGFGDVNFVGAQKGGPVDIVIPRYGASLQTYGSAVLSQFEATGVRAFNPSGSIVLVRNRVQAMQTFVLAGLPLPKAALIRRPDDVDAAIAAVGGLPVMLRRVSGQPTFGALYCETREGCLAALEALWGLGHEVLVSQHFPELRGEALRCLIVRGEAVAAIRRKVRMVRTRFRFERRGKASEVTPPRALAQLLERVHLVTGLNLAGVDVLETRDGYRVLEVNAVPGIEQLEMTTGRDLAKVIVDAARIFVEERGPAVEKGKLSGRATRQGTPGRPPRQGKRRTA
jgi:ribosomal protein S6--L-glutamate ligase